MTDEINKLEKDGMKIVVRGKEVAVDVEVRLTAMDRKAVDAVSGCGGAYCDLCFMSKDASHDCQKISEIKVERTLSSTVQIYESLPTHDNGDLKTAKGD